MTKESTHEGRVGQEIYVKKIVSACHWAKFRLEKLNPSTQNCLFAIGGGISSSKLERAANLFLCCWKLLQSLDAHGEVRAWGLDVVLLRAHYFGNRNECSLSFNLFWVAKALDLFTCLFTSVHVRAIQKQLDNCLYKIYVG